ncbi:MAG TPA: MarR family transcriptional regulator [Acetobacteraceae bacterium]|nr:MarR family transcriptional regulator [Acetobacteraceae bacterium]
MPDTVPPDLDDILGFHIRLAHGAVYRHFNETFGTIGLTQKQTSVLWLVSENPAISQSDIARLIQIDRATMMAITNSLTKRGLLERGASSTDRRRQTLTLTPSGAAALAAAREAVLAHEAWLKARFTAQEATQLAGLLRRIHG